LWDDITNDEIAKILNENESVSETAEKLKNVAVSNGATDNVSVIVVKFP
jgi:serine/threonine protein phosphatase PrpC